MTVDSTNANELIREQVASMLVQPLAAASVILGVTPGPTIFNSSEPLRIPTMTGNFNPSWVGENELIPEEDHLDFGEIELMPTSRKSIKTIVRVSNELIRMATIGVSQVLQNRIVADVRDKLDTALLMGDGAGDTVTGILEQDQVTRAPFTPADPDTVLDGLAWLAGNEVTPNRLIMNGGDFFRIRKLKDADGRGLLQTDLTGGATYALHGTPVSVSNKVPEGKAILADMSQIAVVRDEDARVTLLPERYAEYDQAGIRVTTRYDLGLIRPEAVLILDSEAA